MMSTNLTVFVCLMLILTWYDASIQGIAGDPGTETSTTWTTEETTTSDTMNDTISSNETTPKYTGITDATTTIPPETNLPLILGLSLGLGVPATLAAVGGGVYYFKFYRPKTTRVVI